MPFIDIYIDEKTQKRMEEVQKELCPTEESKVQMLESIVSEGILNAWKFLDQRT